MYRELNDRIKDNWEKREKIKLGLHWHHFELSHEPTIRKSADFNYEVEGASALKSGSMHSIHPSLFGAGQGPGTGGPSFWAWCQKPGDLKVLIYEIECLRSPRKERS